MRYIFTFLLLIPFALFGQCDNLFSLQKSNVGCDHTGDLFATNLTGLAPYTYYLNGVQHPGGSFLNLPAGTYHVKVIDAAGCTLTRTETLTPYGYDFTFNPSIICGDKIKW